MDDPTQHPDFSTGQEARQAYGSEVQTQQLTALDMQEESRRPCRMGMMSDAGGD